MRQKNHRKRAFLFLAAVLLPSAVLVGTTVHMIRQERELAVRRAEEERRLLALQVGQELLEDLRLLGDRIERVPHTPEGIHRLTGSEPALLTIAMPRSGILVFPWELGPGPSTVLDLVASNRHTSLLQWGSEAEHRARDFVQAADLYGRAAEVDNIAPSRSAEARLHQARALLRAERTEEAQAAYLFLSRTSPFLTDMEEMPFFLYGYDGLNRTGTDHRELTRLLEGSLDEVHHFSLTALIAWQTLAEEILAAGPDRSGESGEQGRSDAELFRKVRDAVEERALVLESLERLQADFAGLRAQASTERRAEEGAVGSIWIPYGEEPWLVGFIPGEVEITTRVAVARPASLLGPTERLDSEEPGISSDAVEGAGDPPAWSAMTLLPAGGADGEPLGQGLNGLRAAFPPGYPLSQGTGGVEGWFFRLLLPIILILTGFTAFIAWRDVKREAEAVRLRSQFVSSVTHELKTPLTSIRMFAETLRLGRHSGPDTQQEYLDTVVHETERLSRLINNVLDFARIDRGEMTYHMGATDVGAAVREAARAVAYPLAQGGYTLTTDIAEGLPWVEADSDAMTQAILNLLSNAIKFSDEGSVIDLRVFKEREGIHIRVKDRGRGIAGEDQEAIFQDFFRAAETEEEGIPGTGLGLSLVAHVAEAHGGSVEVESEIGQGSTFTIQIPMNEGLPGEGNAHDG